MLTHEDPVWTSSAAYYDWDPKVAKKFTFRDSFDDKFNMWHREDDFLMLPRAGCPLGEDRRSFGDPVVFPASTYQQQKKDQDRVVAEAGKLLAADESFILQAYTGFGKTVIGSHLMGTRGLKSIVICTKTDILNQWKDSLRMLFDFKEDQIGLIQGKTVRVHGCPVVLSLIQTAHKTEKMPQALAKMFGMVTVDEVHRMAADKFALSMWHQPGIVRLGLSATPERRDGRDRVFLNHIGPVRVVAKGKPMAFKVAFCRTKWSPRGHDGRVVPHKPGRTMHVNKMMAANSKRNTTILSIIQSLYEGKRNVVIFSETVAHLEDIRAATHNMGIPLSDTSLFIGGLTAAQQKTAKSKSLVFATYKMTSEGTDAPWWDACVFIQPRADVVQIVGRITREYPGKKTPIVVDLVDSTRTFELYWKKRLKWYKSQGSKVGEVY